eukprot:GAFH01001767.1.p2 GENE.GAFH01001767.1~~GAFH01001767.1.p2  ORF type:complete len:412 (-),score=97.75 GAFH01001767.1:208-1269(-)
MTGDSSLPLDRIHRVSYIRDRTTFAGNCTVGALTATGCKQHQQLGTQFRQRYVNNGFLPSSFDPSLVYVRSTDVPRTKESLQCNLGTFFPTVQPRRNGGLPVIDIHMMESSAETLLAQSSHCPKISYLLSQTHSSKAWQDYHATLTQLRARLCDISGIPDSAFPGYTVYTDGVACRLADGLPMPKGMTPADYELLSEVQVRELEMEWGSDEMVTLALGLGAGEIVTNFDEKLKGRLGYKLMFYSAHDSTVAPLQFAFGIWRHNFPDFATSIALELYTNATGDAFVRTVYSGREIVPDPCPSPMCPYDIWRRYVTRIVPADYQKACQLPTARLQPEGAAPASQTKVASSLLETA